MTHSFGVKSVIDALTGIAGAATVSRGLILTGRGFGTGLAISVFVVRFVACFGWREPPLAWDCCAFLVGLILRAPIISMSGDLFILSKASLSPPGRPSVLGL